MNNMFYHESVEERNRVQSMNFNISITPKRCQSKIKEYSWQITLNYSTNLHTHKERAITLKFKTEKPIQREMKRKAKLCKKKKKERRNRGHIYINNSILNTQHTELVCLYLQQQMCHNITCYLLSMKPPIYSQNQTLKYVCFNGDWLMYKRMVGHTRTIPNKCERTPIKQLTVFNIRPYSTSSIVFNTKCHKSRTIYNYV